MRRTTQRALNRAQRFSVRLVAPFVEDGVPSYEFELFPPSDSSFSSQCSSRIVRKTYEEFKSLDAVMSRMHGEKAPPLPAASFFESTFFESTDPAVCAERAAGLEKYLDALLELEPMPRSRALRQFLCVIEPVPFDADQEKGAGCVLVSERRLRLPAGVIATALGLCDPAWMLRNCSAVCKAFEAASRSPSCWPSLLLRTGRAERWLESLYSLLVPTCATLQSLTLDLGFEHVACGVAPPAGLLLPNLRRLALRLTDSEAVRVGAELIDSVASPHLKVLDVEGGRLTANVLRAVCVAAFEAEGGLERLRLRWSCDGRVSCCPPLWLGEDTTGALDELVSALPSVQELELGIIDELRGACVSRGLAARSPLHQDLHRTSPILAELAALQHLRHLVFDFLADEVLAALHDLSDRSMMLRVVRLSGVKRRLENPEDALAVLLRKLGDCLEELSLIVEIEQEMRQFMSGVFRTRIGALPDQWRDRHALRTLHCNWIALDDDGIACIVDNCPQLHTLLLDCSEYWTDQAVLRVVEGLPQLRRFRVRQSVMLSDRSLYALAESGHSFESVEIQPSYSMSKYALNMLKDRLHPVNGFGTSPNGNGFGSFEASLGFGDIDNDLSQGALGLIHAAAGVPQPQPPPTTTRYPGIGNTSSEQVHVLKLLSSEEALAEERAQSEDHLHDFQLGAVHSRRPFEVGW